MLARPSRLSFAALLFGLAPAAALAQTTAPATAPATSQTAAPQATSPATSPAAQSSAPAPSPATPAAPAAAPAPAPADTTPAAPASAPVRHRHHPAHHREHHRVSHADAAAASPVVLSQQPGTALDTAARQLDTEDLSGAAKRGETPIVLIGSAPIAVDHGDPALFVQVQSASLCGSAGCSTSVYLRRGGTWTKVLDSVSGPIKVLPTAHGGMYDLMVGDRDRWVWRGSTYHDTLPSAPISNLRSSVERHQALTGQKGG